MRIAVGNDHAGLALRSAVLDELRQLEIEAIDLGTEQTENTDFPDYATLVGRAMQEGRADRGILICGSGVGMCIAANKMRGLRACVTHDTYSAHQGVEHDGMNVLCLGAQIIGDKVARELIRAFVNARFLDKERYQRRIDKIMALEAELG